IFETHLGLAGGRASEANLPAEPATSEEDPRVPGADVDPGWPEGPQAPPCQGSSPSHRVNGAGLGRSSEPRYRGATGAGATTRFKSCSGAALDSNGRPSFSSGCVGRAGDAPASRPGADSAGARHGIGRGAGFERPTDGRSIDSRRTECGSVSSHGGGRWECG